jgi:hypothetical protein
VIELAEVIRDLRSELVDAMGQGKDELLQFALGPIELELTIGMEKKGGGSTKVRFWVMEVGAEASVATSGTQRIKLTLQPEMAGSRATPMVADVAGSKET